MEVPILAVSAALALSALMYLVAGRLFGDWRSGTAAAIVFATTPLLWRMLQDGLRPVVPLVFVLGWLFAAVRFAETGEKAWAALAGTALGLGVHTSYAAAVTMPVYLMVTVAIFGGLRRDAWRALGVMAAAFSLAAAPFAVAVLLEPEKIRAVIVAHRLYDADRFNVLQGLREMTSWVGLTARSEVYYDYFNPAFLFLTERVLLLPLAFLLPAGVYRILHGAPTPLPLLTVAGFCVAPVAAALTAEPPTASRILFLLPFAALLSTYGLQPLLVRFGGSRPAR